jgi:hypothetical protein
MALQAVRDNPGDIEARAVADRMSRATGFESFKSGGSD